MPLHTQKGRQFSFRGRVALKLVVTKLVCVKLVINLWRSTPPEKKLFQEATGILHERVYP